MENLDDDRAVVTLMLLGWALLMGVVLAFIRGATRTQRSRPAEPLPPGYGERYYWRGYFNPDDTMAAESPDRPDDDLLAPMPEDLWGEPTNVIDAYRRFTACQVCGYKARICSSAACPQRRVMP